jgi:hypothetical protein
MSTGLHTRNALHQYNVRHAGHMPEMDAIRRSDTVREAKHAGMQMSGESDENGGFIAVVLLAAFVAALVGVVWLTR